ncbi:unnamed protein product [Protopolystoma xenopodis]|uniref:Uncharacterized protein n=1 Tax=Protopolystoma xenopodis TaxID=117903 RepID=A0A448X7D8_9PLAT|nr:unnamed protein product [Protopolystoma xenopodis]
MESPGIETKKNADSHAQTNDKKPSSFLFAWPSHAEAPAQADRNTREEEVTSEAPEVLSSDHELVPDEPFIDKRRRRLAELQARNAAERSDVLRLIQQRDELAQHLLKMQAGS